MDEFDFPAKRDRSPLFPYVGLEQALDYAQQLYSKARRAEVRLSDAAVIWGFSPTSSSVLRVAAALTTFGLAIDKGAGDDRRIVVSDLTIRILEDERVGARENGMRDAAAKAAIIKRLYEDWGDERPADSVALSSLKFDYGFVDAAAKRFLRVYDNTVPFLKPLNSEKEFTQPAPVSSRREIRVSDSRIGIGSVESGIRHTDEPHRFDQHDWFIAKLPNGPAVSIRVGDEMSAANIKSLIRLLETLREEMLDEENK